MIFKQIKYKIGFTIFAAFLCGLAVLMALTQWSIKKQFLEFTSERTRDSLIPLEAIIVKSYTDDGNLNRYKDNQELWKRTTQRIIRENIRRNRKNQAPQTRNDRSEARADNSWEQQLRKSQRMFLSNLSLYDANNIRIVGARNAIGTQQLYPINSGEKNIAYIGYTEPREFTRDSEYVFWNQQIKSFWILSILMLLVSLIAASIIARKISKPLSELSKATNKLADGNRIDPIISSSDDEIGQLCHAFNKMSRQLSDNEAARKRWVADISHEMRTPLAVLKAQIEAIEDGIRPVNKENLALLSNKITGINHLIDDLYELSLYDVGSLSYDKKPFSLNDHINDFAVENKNIFIEKNLTFSFKKQTHENEIVYADKYRIDQLLNNIMQNSLRYTTSPGKVEWLTESTNNDVTIIMRDSAPGLATEKLELIFDRLYRGEASRNKETGGAGLGLSICKSIVLAHEGEIWAEPSPLGGIQIKIKLPSY